MFDKTIATAVVLLAVATHAAEMAEVTAAGCRVEDGVSDASAPLQKLIDEHPNRTIYLPDGVYLLSRPIVTPAHPLRSVDLRLANYATLRAAPGWTNVEAMVRLGGKDPANDIRTPGSLYGFTGGILDGAGVANGLSIDGGRETRVRDVSMKRVKVGLRIKRGANSGSSDADIRDVNIVGNAAPDSIGVLVEGYDNTFTCMRIAGVQTGVLLKGGGNSLRNIHPLHTCGYRHYATSVGFDDRSGNNWYDFCYSDHFSIGFSMDGGRTSVFDKCFCMWYAPTPGLRHTAFRAGSFNAHLMNFTIGFNGTNAVNTVLEELKPATGAGVIENIRVDRRLVNEKPLAYERYLKR